MSEQSTDIRACEVLLYLEAAAVDPAGKSID